MLPASEEERANEVSGGQARVYYSDEEEGKHLVEQLMRREPGAEGRIVRTPESRPQEIRWVLQEVGSDESFIIWRRPENPTETDPTAMAQEGSETWTRTAKFSQVFRQMSRIEREPDPDLDGAEPSPSRRRRRPRSEPAKSSDEKERPRRDRQRSAIKQCESLIDEARSSEERGKIEEAYDLYR